MKLLKSTKFWMAVFGVFLVSAVVAAYFVNNKTVEGPVANIYQDGELIRSIALDEVEEGYTFKIENEDGCYNVIEVQHGRIRVAEANCPDQICVNQGWISDGIEPIVCLPHGLVIEITGADSEIDAAS